MSSTEWDGIAGVLPVILWLLFLVLRKRKQRPAHVDDDHDPATPLQPTRRRRYDETPEFQRNYDPIEPS